MSQETKPVPGKKRQLLMKDIAEIAGVSKSTVSRALKGDPRIKAETRERIAEIATAYNYTVNEGARRFRSQSSHVIAIVSRFDPLHRPHAYDPFFQNMLGAIADAAGETDYDLLLSHFPGGDHRWEDFYLHSNRCEGLILIGQGNDDNQLNRLASEGANIVVWGAIRPHNSYVTVGSNNFEGGFLAAEHLLRLGRRNLLFLGNADLPEISQRFQGFLKAHVEAGVALNHLAVSTPDFQTLSGENAIKDLIENGTRFDGVVASSDTLAMGAIKALHRKSISVPRDVAVVGYDDVSLAADYSPALTTVSQNILEGGHALVQTLLALIDGKQPSSVELDTRLMVRESCGVALS